MKKLPVVGTTAPTTTFCAQRIDGPEGTFLYVDGNQKITAGNGSYDAPLPNAFSLMAEAVVQREQDPAVSLPYLDCPGSTPTCRKSCYVHGLEKHAGDTYELYRHNSAEIRRILAKKDLADAWVLIMARWIGDNAAGGFRWHVSGDVFSAEYAQWIADVVRESSQVVHWIYTRSFDDEIIEPLLEVSTIEGGPLSLNLSCDKDNYVKAAALRARTFVMQTGAHLRLCYLVETGDPVIPPLREGDVIFPDYDLRPKSVENAQSHPFWQSLTVAERNMLCPVDAYGKSEKTRCGPCNRCLT